MIKYNPKTWFRPIFSFRKSDTFAIIWKEMVYIFLLTIGLTYAELNYFPGIVEWNELLSVYSLIGFVLSLLLVFRTNTAYDRWWEGRKKWGELVNNTRNLASKIASLSNDPETRAYFARMIPNYAIAMKEHLRQGVDLDELNLTKEEREILEKSNHRPNIISTWIYQAVRNMKKHENLSEEEILLLDINLKTFADIIGACERIKNTPIPYSYSIFLKKFIFIYVTTIPLAIITWFGYFSCLITVFIFYVLVSLEILAEEIEDPFGKDDNDLPTDDLAYKIKANVEEILA
ncbi:bestrophin family protein [Crocinitomix algicola]|uniref:bestrophin family protein n=1 Tax=Crocinitomix algicola TaxID=1740263 RepID=UPI00082ED86A|nr:bestrophin family ion channel [Crocinitomix algicola]